MHRVPPESSGRTDSLVVGVDYLPVHFAEKLQGRALDESQLRVRRRAHPVASRTFAKSRLETSIWPLVSFGRRTSRSSARLRAWNMRLADASMWGRIRPVNCSARSSGGTGTG